GESVETFVVKVTGDKFKALRKVHPDILTKRGARSGFNGLLYIVVKSFFIPLPAAVTDEGKISWQQTSVGRVINCWQRLLAGKDNVHIEDDHAGRFDNMG